MIDITGIDKAALLAELHNGSRAMGMGALHDISRDMTTEEARVIITAGDDRRRMFPGAGIKRELYFDYVQGRPLKADLSGDEFNPALYDRDNGQGAGAAAVERARARADKETA